MTTSQTGIVSHTPRDYASEVIKTYGDSLIDYWSTSATPAETPPRERESYHRSALPAERSVVSAQSIDEQLPRFLGIPHSELLQIPVRQDQDLIQDIVSRATLGSIVGLPDSFKSWLALHLVFAVAAGQPFLGRTVPEAGAVGVWLQDDSTRNLLARVQSLASKLKLPPDLPIQWHLNEGLEFPHHVDILQREVKERRQALVILDSAYVFMPKIDLQGETVAEIYTQLKATICDQARAAVCIVDHSPWSYEGKSRQRRPFGSVFKSAACRWSLHLERRKANTVSVLVSGNNVRRTEDMFEWDENELEFDPVLSAPREAGRESDEQSVKSRILRWLCDNPSCMSSQIAQGVRKRRKTVESYLEGLKSEGKVNYESGGRTKRAKLWSCIEPNEVTNACPDPAQGA